MSFILFQRRFVLLAVVLLAMSLSVHAKEESKKVFQTNDSKKPNYLANRRALVGPDCVLNSVFNGKSVGLANTLSDIENLFSENLDDSASYAYVASATSGGDILGVKDMRNYYARGTEAGFALCVVGKGVGVDIGGRFKIQFYRDGSRVGEAATSQQSGNTGLGIGVVGFSGNASQSLMFLSATAPGEFNEIRLCESSGVSITVAAALKIKYAFVGKPKDYTLTLNPDNGIAKYPELSKRKVTLSCPDDSAVIDTDLNNDAPMALNAFLLVTSKPIQINLHCEDGKEALPANTDIGFRIVPPKQLISVSLLKLQMTVTFYDRNGAEVGSLKTADGGLVSVKVGDFSSQDREIVVRAPAAFSSVKIETGLKAGVSLESVPKLKYAFIRMAPDLASHHCAINATANIVISGSEFLLQSNPHIKVKWKLCEHPDGSKVRLDGNEVSGLDKDGDYVFTATAEDGCADTTVIHKGLTYKPEEHGVRILVNKGGANTYSLSDRTGFSLLNVLGHQQGGNAILTPSLSDFVSVNPGLDVAGNKAIIGVKSTKGERINLPNKEMVVGFVVSAKATALNADVLSFFNIKLYDKGKEVTTAGGVTRDWQVVSAGLVGSAGSQKMRLCIRVPHDTEFDEVALFKSGVANVSLSQLRVYYAYVCDAGQDNATINDIYGSTVVSVRNTNASYDWKQCKFFNVATISSGYENIGNLIDDDIDSYVSMPMGVKVGGCTLAVNVGRTVNPGQQLVVVMKKSASLLGVNLLNVLKVSTYGEDKENEIEHDSNWKLLDASVIGGRQLCYMVINPSKPFTQVRITQANPVQFGMSLDLCALVIRTDMNDDGSLSRRNAERLILNEDQSLNVQKEYKDADMVLYRKFSTNKWNSLVLPVNMTLRQVREAFGVGTRLSEFYGLLDNCIYFHELSAPGSDDEVFLKKNTPYVIRPTQEPTLHDLNTGTGVEATEKECYFATGINYTNEDCRVSCTTGKYGKLSFTGTYAYMDGDNHPHPVSGDFVLKGGDMWRLVKDHKTKAYHCWVVASGQQCEKVKMAMFSSFPREGKTTDVRVVDADEQRDGENAKIHTINGVYVGNRSVSELSPGVYIINNKKVIKKR